MVKEKENNEGRSKDKLVYYNLIIVVFIVKVLFRRINNDRFTDIAS